ncbi:MAG: hypothetical protein V5A38_11290 [Halolamina sp.]|uniref:Nmad3 family putative nucleotide modification protein n=1 Tax=Halolamina sp. TaxID=1940283 RepID=UPI002FC372C4
MTVALLGVGADSTNASPTPPLYPDGRFEYIPIPESQGPEGTVETRTYDSSPLRYRDAPMADYLDAIVPDPNEGTQFTGAQLADWPLHHDPNFEALTYGETTSRGSYTKILRTLEPGDLVAFYTGLRSDAAYRHRYIIGYFTVAELIDFQRVERDGRELSFSDFPAPEQDALMHEHCENAHAKRFEATGEIAANDGLVIVEGTEPGGLLDEAFRISQHGGGGHHYLTDELQETFSPEPGGNPDRNAHLGGIKTAHVLDIAPAAFRQLVG